jgi:hypothetical protein
MRDHHDIMVLVERALTDLLGGRSTQSEVANTVSLLVAAVDAGTHAEIMRALRQP